MQMDKITQEPNKPVDKEPDSPEATEPQESSKGFARIWESLVGLGLGESALRVGTSVISISLFLIVVWVMGSFYLNQRANPPSQAALAVPLIISTNTPVVPTPVLQPYVVAVDYSQGIPRLASLHTTIPTRPRNEITTYTVQKGDTLFGIAEKVNLKPETILWSNRETLADDPEYLKVGMVLNILPLDGAYHKWSAGEGLNGVAKFFGVKPEDIINYPGNKLSADTIGDYAHPNIPPGAMLVIPGGYGVFPEKTPRILRSNPAAAAALGPGYCKNVASGYIGSGTFIWPTTWRFLSGYDYSPATGHYAIDIAGDFGNPIYAADSGVVVFAGPSQRGYGNEVVIDHGNGWQTLYAHLIDGGIYVSCGQSVLQGATIGAMGSTGNSTGPHLHFEMRHDTYGRVNPWDFLR
jgi:murein DD-endopeptidase MepM/ murein hydrolase activator NlpD